MKMTVKGMTRKQLITLLEDRIRNDNVCITEGDMCLLFEECADEYDVDNQHSELEFTLRKLNNYWSPIRMFLPRLNDKLKGIKL